MADPFEVVATEDKEQFQTKHGSTLQSFNLTAKDKTGAVVLIQMNRKPTSPPPVPGETVWLDTWNTDYGLKGKKMQGPRQAPAASGDDRDRSIIRQHSQHMALLFAGLIDVKIGDAAVGLKTIEAWTDHFDADVQRASGTAQEVGGAIAGETRPASAPAPSRTPQTGQSPPPAPSRASNGDERTITQAQQQRAQRIATSNALTVEDKEYLLKSFGVEKLKDLPMSKFNAFQEAMVNPIPNGSSDVPSEYETASVASPEDDEIPF